MNSETYMYTYKTSMYLCETVRISIYPPTGVDTGNGNRNK